MIIFLEDDSDTVIDVRVLTWWKKFEKRKHLKKSKELMPVVLHSIRWYDCFSEDGNK